MAVESQSDAAVMDLSLCWACVFAKTLVESVWSTSSDQTKWVMLSLPVGCRTLQVHFDYDLRAGDVCCGSLIHNEEIPFISRCFRQLWKKSLLW